MSATSLFHENGKLLLRCGIYNVPAKSTTVCSQNTNKQIVNIAEENLTDYSFLIVGITILNQRII